MSRFSLVHVAVIKLAALALWAAGLPFGWACALFFAPDPWVFYHLFAPGASGLVRTFTRFETPRREIWLTIDDGPDEHDTPQLLDLLDQHNARASFFLVGKRAARHPALVAEIARRGHEIAHHTHRHRGALFWCALPGTLRREIDDALPALAPVGVASPRRFRPPVGIKNLFLARVLSVHDLACVGWSVRSLDSFARSPHAVADRVMRQIRPGAIVLLHEGGSLHPSVRVTAIKLVLEQLAAHGYRCVIPTDAQLK